MDVQYSLVKITKKEKELIDAEILKDEGIEWQDADDPENVYIKKLVNIRNADALENRISVTNRIFRHKDFHPAIH